jgi:hypothetical protein
MPRIFGDEPGLLVVADSRSFVSDQIPDIREINRGFLTNLRFSWDGSTPKARTVKV